MDGLGCVGHGWSVVSAAAANSQLAGVLAGFVFSGIIILFGRKGSKSTKAIGLFCSAFVILSFDSYVYGMVVGGQGDAICARVWSEAMPAGGMLGVGGVAVVTGICWLLATHLEGDAATDTDDPSNHATIHLHRLSRVMVHGVTTAVSLLLVSAAVNYLAVVFDHRPPTWLTWVVFAVPLAVSGTALGLDGWRSWRARKEPSHGDVPVLSTSLTAAAIGVLLYAIVGPAVAGGLLTDLPDRVWTPASPLLVALGLTTGLVLPGFLLVLLAFAAPPLHVTGRPATQTDPSSEVPARKNSPVATPT